MANRIRVLLVDDSEVFLDRLERWLSEDPEFRIVGRARSGRAALEQVQTSRPDLVLMDVSMSDIHGFAVTGRIKSRPEAPLVVLMSFHDSQAARLEAWAAGADGFLPKSDVVSVLIPTVRSLVGAREQERDAAVKPAVASGDKKEGSAHRNRSTTEGSHR